MSASAWLGITGAETLERFGELAEEARLVETGVTKSPLADTGIVRVTGGDATTFLHGQLAADLVALPEGSALQTAWCSPKGRVLFLLRAIRRGADDWLLLLPADQAGAFVRRLGMFVLRAAVSVEDISTRTFAFACRASAPGAAPAPPDGDALAVAHESVTAGAPGTAWVVAPRDALAGLWQAAPGEPVGLEAAALADVRHGRPRLAAELADTFLPQELDLDALGGVSFEKGCYPGQEIVARVKFRGTVKYRLRRLAVGTVAPPPAGTRVVADDSTETLGTLLYGAPVAGGGCECLAVCKPGVRALALEDHPDAAVEALSLPYAADDGAIG